MAPIQKSTGTRALVRLRRLGAGVVAASLLLVGDPTGAVGTDPSPQADSAQPEGSTVPTWPTGSTPSAAAQLPPTVWLPWQHTVQLESVTRHAPHTWALATALGQIPGTGAAQPLATGPTPPLRPTSNALNPLDYKWPVWPVTIRRAFNPPKETWGRGHRGVDLEGVPGQPVFAAGPGVVSWSGTINSVGSLSVTHTPRLRTTYLPLTGRLPLGTPVIAGVPVGLLAPGHCLPACLHWGAKVSARRYVDPTLLPDFAPELKPRDERRRR
ncbi:M23 family metallopeptidase [Kytococcus sedentarius]|uniref:M23 family metallopeptidase n=1 Tax=Kytococcus sedentarius TaxID=1276 RepID=UPI0035BBFFCB